MMSLLCLLCLVVIGVPGCCSVSKDESNFFTLYNGNFNNSAEIANGFLLFQVRLKPVSVPALEGPTVFIEAAFNGSIIVLQLGEVVDVYKNKIRVKLYDIRNSTNLKPLTYDVKKVSKLQRGDLRSYDDCFAIYELKGQDVLTVSYPACNIVNKDGTNPRFTGTLSCRQYSLNVPVGVVEERFAVTYTLLNGRRFPLPQAYISEDFVSPCEDSVVY